MFKKGFENTVIEIIDNEKYYVEIEEMSINEYAQKIKIEAEIENKLKIWNNILLKKLPFPGDFGGKERKLILLDSKEVEDKLHEYKYKFCTINEKIKFYVHTKQIHGFSFFLGGSLHFYPNLSTAIESYLLYTGMSFLSDSLIDPYIKSDKLKNPSNSSNSLESWNIDMYVTISSGFGGAVPLPNIQYYPETSSFTFPLKPDNKHIGNSVIFNFMYQNIENYSHISFLHNYDFYSIILSYMTSEQQKLYTCSVNNAKLTDKILYLSKH